VKWSRLDRDQSRNRGLVIRTDWTKTIEQARNVTTDM